MALKLVKSLFPLKRHDDFLLKKQYFTRRLTSTFTSRFREKTMVVQMQQVVSFRQSYWTKSWLIPPTLQVSKVVENGHSITRCITGCIDVTTLYIQLLQILMPSHHAANNIHQSAPLLYLLRYVCKAHIGSLTRFYITHQFLLIK